METTGSNQPQRLRSAVVRPASALEAARPRQSSVHPAQKPWTHSLDALGTTPTLSNAESDVSEPRYETTPARWELFKPWTTQPGNWSPAISKPSGVAPPIQPFQNSSGQVYRVVATPVAVPPPQVAASPSAILVNGHLLVRNVSSNSPPSDFFWSHYFY